eukprot:3571520-Pyramimonas_sp.AAC.1
MSAHLLVGEVEAGQLLVPLPAVVGKPLPVARLGPPGVVRAAGADVVPRGVLGLRGALLHQVLKRKVPRPCAPPYPPRYK